MKKLKIEELHVESFATSSETSRRGTVVAHSGDTWCTSEAHRTSCSPAQCTDTTGGTHSEVTICGGTDANTNCCHPYDISLDWTFCDDTMCC